MSIKAKIQRHGFTDNHTLPATWMVVSVFFLNVVSCAFLLPTKSVLASGHYADKTSKKVIINDSLKAKLKAIESLFKSPMTLQIKDSRVEEARALITQANYNFIVANGLIEEGKMPGAEKQVDIALQKMGKAMQVFSWSKPEEETKQSKNRKKYLEILESTTLYKNSFLETARQKGPAVASLLNLRKLDRLLGLAAKEAEKGQYRNAFSIAEQAYILAEAAIIKVSENVTVVYQNTFQTPADEYRYEQERFTSYGEVVMAKMSEIRLSQSRSKNIQSLITNGEITRQNADKLAETGKYDKAIKEINRASSYMISSLKVLGVMTEGYGR